MVAVYLSTMGPDGIKHIAETCYHRAHYMANKIDQIEGFKVTSTNFFNEFVIESKFSIKKINALLLKNGIEGGIDISNRNKNLMMVAVTELNTPSHIDEVINELGAFIEK